MKAYAGGNEVAKEVTARKLKALRRQLRGPDPSPLEDLLATRIALNWLTLYYAEMIYATPHARSRGACRWTPGTHCQERIDRCQKRYLSAIRALAQLRRVAITVARVVDPDGRHAEAARVEG